MAADRFEQQILDRLTGLGEVTARAMFDGHGFYWGETIFAIAYAGRLFLKVDERSKGDFEARGMGPFHPNERQTLKSYYEVPPEVLADPEALLSWVKEAIRAGQSSSGPGQVPARCQPPRDSAAPGGCCVLDPALRHPRSRS